MSWRTTTEIMNALKTKLAGLTFPVGHALEGQMIFESVRLYDVPELEKALQDLLEYKNRICLLIPGEELWRTSQSGNSVSSHRQGDFLLVMSDRDYGPGKPSFFGDATYPGIINFKENVLSGISGESLGLKGVVLMPMGGRSLQFKGSNNEKNFREGYQVFVKANMGTQQFTLTRGASLKHG